MAEIITGEFSKYSNPLIDDMRSMKCWLWDCGPDEPELPDPPEPPTGKAGDPKYDLANLQFKRALRAYEAGLEKYERDQKEFDAWKKHNGGPIEILRFSVDAFDAIKHDLRAVFEGRQKKPRYFVSKRNSRVMIQRIVGSMQDILTREKVELSVSTGLPKGVKPGHGHQANIERELAVEKEFVSTLRADPHFGQEMQA